MHRWLGGAGKGPARRSLLPALLLASAASLAASGCQAPNDWCSTIVVRPDQRFVPGSNCVPVWSETEIAYGAEVVLLGDFTEVTQSAIPTPARLCAPSPSHAANATYAARLRLARSLTGRPPLKVVHLARFDLVPATFAATPGFSTGYLLRTTTPWSAVTGFFRNDRTAPCLPSGCTWSDSWGGNPSNDPGRRIRDFIDLEAGLGAHQSHVYYLARPDGTGTHWPTAAIADLRSANYRTWRVEEAKRSLAVGGYDMVELNHKFQQFRAGEHWLGGFLAPDVATLHGLADTFWSAEPAGYRYAEYVAGWYALSLNLAMAGVPYAVTLPHQVWTSTKYDDASTPSVDEGALLRDAAERAALVMVDVLDSYPSASWQALAQTIGSRGARVVRFDQSCPLRP